MFWYSRWRCYTCFKESLLGKEAKTRLCSTVLITFSRQLGADFILCQTCPQTCPPGPLDPWQDQAELTPTVLIHRKTFGVLDSMKEDEDRTVVLYPGLVVMVSQISYSLMIILPKLVQSESLQICQVLTCKHLSVHMTEIGWNHQIQWMISIIPDIRWNMLKLSGSVDETTLILVKKRRKFLNLTFDLELGY